jgi:hypothetical protein
MESKLLIIIDILRSLNDRLSIIENVIITGPKPVPVVPIVTVPVPVTPVEEEEILYKPRSSSSSVDSDNFEEL